MRNSSREHNCLILPRFAAAVFVLLQWPCGLQGDQVFTITSEDMVAIRADKGWEDIQSDTVHFAGHFQMRIRDAELTANRATVYGKLDNPDRLILRGSPARISLSHSLNNQAELIVAEANQIVYEREGALMRLTGAARLAEGDNVVLSDGFEYDIKNDRYRSIGKGGVEVRVRPPR